MGFFFFKKAFQLLYLITLNLYGILSVHVTTDELSRKIWPAILQPYYKEDAVPDYREKNKRKKGKKLKRKKNLN